MLKAPFPWFGGKSRAASLIWERFGRVDNYVEPFAGSLAVLLGNPHPPKVETVNDKDALLANFWRAVKWAPDAVAEHCDWPVNEADLHARHRWLVERISAVTSGMEDPEWFDAQIAGWWVWGRCSWLGRGWCTEPGWRQLPELASDRGIRKQIPHLGDLELGVHASTRTAVDEIRSLAERLRRVRVCCGDWKRIISPSVTWRHGMTGALLDPPYDEVEHSGGMYASEGSISHDVAIWARKNADNPLMRIALCGYAGEHDMPGWTAVEWKANGGYGNQGQGRGRENAKRETIWFSPHCLDAKQLGLFPLEGR